MKRRRNGMNAVSAFFDGFNQGYDTTGRVLQDIELGKIANAKPEEETITEQTMQGFQGQAPDASGATSQTDLGDAPMVQRKVTKFLGQTFDQPPSTDQIERVRSGRVADALAKFNPQAGLQMRRELARDDREAWRTEREKAQATRDDERLAREKAYEDGKNKVFADTAFGRLQQTYADKLKEWKAAGGAGAPPARPAYSLADSVGDQATLFGYDMEHGKVDTKQFGQFTESMRKIQEEGYEKALRLAHQGAPLQEVAKAFNSSGATRFDPAEVVSDKPGAGRDGVPTRIITLKDGTTIDTMAALDSLGRAGEVVNRYYKGKEDARQDSEAKNAKVRLGLAVQEGNRERDRHEAGAPERWVTAQLGKMKQDALNEKATPEQREAAARRYTEAQTLLNQPKGGGNTPAEIQLAKEFVRTGAFGVKTEAQAYEQVRKLKERSPNDAFLDLVKSSQSYDAKARVAEAEDMMKAMGYTKGARGWMQAEQSGALGGASAIPPAAVDYLRKNPGQRAAFEAKYGAGTAAQYLN